MQSGRPLPSLVDRYPVWPIVAHPSQPNHAEMIEAHQKMTKLRGHSTPGTIIQFQEWPSQAIIRLHIWPRQAVIRPHIWPSQAVTQPQEWLCHAIIRPQERSSDPINDQVKRSSNPKNDEVKQSSDPRSDHPIPEMISHAIIRSQEWSIQLRACSRSNHNMQASSGYPRHSTQAIR